MSDLRQSPRHCCGHFLLAGTAAEKKVSAGMSTIMHPLVYSSSLTASWLIVRNVHVSLKFTSPTEDRLSLTEKRILAWNLNNNSDVNDALYIWQFHVGGSWMIEWKSSKPPPPADNTVIWLICCQSPIFPYTRCHLDCLLRLPHLH